MQDTGLLLRRAQKGDMQAFEALMAPYESRIYGLCLRMLGNREDALDCAQDVMLNIWRALAKYRKEASFTTWIYRVAKNACFDALRKRKNRPSVSLEVLGDMGFLPADERDDPHASAVSAARKQALEAGIAQLGPDMRIALILRDIQGLSYDEIADILQLPIGTVKSRISRARDKLRMLLLKDGELFDAGHVCMVERRDDV